MPVTIVAQAGFNHGASLAVAKQMALVAQKCGADGIEYPICAPDGVLFAQKAAILKDAPDAEPDGAEGIAVPCLDFAQHEELKEYCDEIGIRYIPAPLDIAGVRFLGTLRVPLVKIPSCEITDLPCLEQIAALHTPVLLSTGMSTLDEITNAVGVLDDGGCPEVTVLQCNTQHPTPFADANLTAMLDLYDQFGLPVGLSDHTPGVTCAVAAVALGACVIEKHFTPDRGQPVQNRADEVDPDGLLVLVQAVRNTEQALGGDKKVTQSEAPNRTALRKSIVAACDIKKGAAFTAQNLTTKCPADGICPMRWHEVLGQIAKRDFVSGEKIEV